MWDGDGETCLTRSFVLMVHERFCSSVCVAGCGYSVWIIEMSLSFMRVSLKLILNVYDAECQYCTFYAQI